MGQPPFSKPEFGAGHVQSSVGFGRHRIHSGEMTGEDWTRLAREVPGTAAAPLAIRTPVSLTMAELPEQARTLVAERKIQLLAVDGIQDMQEARETQRPPEERSKTSREAWRR
ncbi:DnaB-like helicase C-terminal domain-containing protein [Streptomyces sp. NPDC093510]|uniref:DnaB-like helicase C-terminal domain-containing protein n=1 Tax=Streptomyces sp. NPDC093510 TaxID=3155199 RepID=UPI003414923F